MLAEIVCPGEVPAMDANTGGMRTASCASLLVSGLGSVRFTAVIGLEGFAVGCASGAVRDGVEVVSGLVAGTDSLFGTTGLAFLDRSSTIRRSGLESCETEYSML